MIALRRFKQEDASFMANLANNAKIASNLRDGFPHPFTLVNALSFIEKANAQQPQMIFAIEWDGKYVGNLGIHPKDDIYSQTAEIGYFIGEPFWGNGIASKAIGIAIEKAFNEFNLIRLEAGVFEHNIPSMRVLEKNGFFKEGIAQKVAVKNGKILDEHRYAIINPALD